MTDFDEKDVLSEIDLFLEHCEKIAVPNDAINDINMQTYNYCNQAKMQRPPRYIKMTYKYLKEEKIKAVPFDKGLGFCLMSEKDYEEKLSKITSLKQFTPEITTRTNAKDPVIKEEERINNALKKLCQEGRLDDDLRKKLKSTGAKPARIYGLAKVHKEDVPLRPIVSMPATAYDNLGKWISKWLNLVPEGKIDTGTADVSQEIRKLKLESDESLISFDVTQLYTHVPLNESIELAASKLYQIRDDIPVDMNTFIELAKLACSSILIKSHDGYIRQVDGLAMGIQCAPQLANIWMASFDKYIRGNSQFYKRYMDDVLRIIKKNEIDRTLESINQLHPNLAFTKETENIEGKIAFLDMNIVHKKDGTIETEWYRKATDTGLTINFHALAPTKYKRGMVINLVYRIFNATSSWELFDKGLNEGKEILASNQYPEEWYENIINKTIEKIFRKEKKISDEEDERKMVFIQYRGPITDSYVQKLKETGAPIKPILTLRKVKTVLPSLKQNIEKVITSNIIYQFKCTNCNVSYVGMTTRHLCTRVNEHRNNAGEQATIRMHAEQCLGRRPMVDDFVIL